MRWKGVWSCKAKLTGVFNLTGSNISIYGVGSNGLLDQESVILSGITPLERYSYTLDKYHPLLLIGAISVIVTVVLFLVARQRTKKLLVINCAISFWVFFPIFRVIFRQEVQTAAE